jgi:NIMA (never in mitosis gene a)-related kinase
MADGQRDALYQQVRSLGRTAFGEVVLYRRVEDDSLIVWKEIDLSGATDKELCLVKKEVALLALMDHPNVISFYNDYIDAQTLLIEMEYANGGTLQEKIRCRTSLFSEEVIWWHFFQIASAVEHIHKQGVLHREITPANIFLTKSGLCKLGDFGLGLIMKERKDMAISNVRTCSYMAPELHLGGHYNQKTDVWSVGCVLFELCELDVPFRGSNPTDFAKKTKEFKVPNIHPQYTNDLQVLIKGLLAKAPDDRPAMEDVLETPIVKATRADMESKIAQLHDPKRQNNKFSGEGFKESPKPEMTRTFVSSEVGLGSVGFNVRYE